MDLAAWRRFARAALANPAAVGAIAPSSRSLAHAMVDWIDWPNARTVLEFGPGTGVFTQYILERLPPGGRLIAIELDPRLARDLQQRFPDALVIHGNVADAPDLCRPHGVTHADAVLSGLPWAAFKPHLQHACLEALLALLRPSGQFATFAYLQGLLLPAGKRFAALLDERFPHVSRSPTVWANLPPALIYRCRR